MPDDPDGTGPLPRPAPYAAYVNLPQTKTTGFELETIWYPTDNLRFIFNYGYTNPEIGDSPVAGARARSVRSRSGGPAARDQRDARRPPPANRQRAPTHVVGVQGQNLNGNILPFSPKNKIALNGTYTWDFEDGSTLDASLSYFWQDISYSSIFNRSYTEDPVLGSDGCAASAGPAATVRSR